MLSRWPRALNTLLGGAAWTQCVGQTAKLHAHASSNPLGLPAFVFDIDGVLIRGGHVLPAAKQAMSQLCQGGQFKYPVVFMTNGGGCTEDAKAAQLAGWLDAPITADQVILSHTPMRALASRLGSLPVLVSGRGDLARVAASYGFTRAVTTEQLWHRLGPTATPFAPPPPAGAPPPTPAAQDAGTPPAPFAAVLVLNDPANWYVDAQLVVDVLGAHGVVAGGREAQHGGGRPVELYFSNPDLLWANEFPRPRLGQGAFAHMVLSLYRELTGCADLPFPVKFYGKPNPEPYRLAEQLLSAQAARILGQPAPGPAASEQEQPQRGPAPSPVHPAQAATSPHAPQIHSKHAPHSSKHSTPPAPASGLSHGQHPRPTATRHLSSIYAVGDNPAADVRGANAAGSPWVSVLVRTGVFCGPGPNCTKDAAAIAVDDVAGAVAAAMHRTRSLRWFSMR